MLRPYNYSTLHLAMEIGFERWALFNVVVLALLLLDLGVLRRKSHDVKLKEALCWSAFWILLAMAFCGGIWYFNDRVSGQHHALEFLTGYLTEYALSVDNIFVFILIFTYFRVSPEHRHKVLFWGIMGALFMRAAMIYAGVALIERFHFVIYFFGAFLLFTGIKMAFHNDDDIDPSENPVVKIFKKVMPVTPDYRGSAFFVVENGKRFATPLFIVLLVIESSDLIFAVDSIPAIIGISKDPFVIYTSNVFAILGLRSLYFALAGVMDLFHHLKYALAFILSFVGVKMLIEYWYKIPISVSLGVIVVALLLSIIASLLWPLPAEESLSDEAPELMDDTKPEPLPESARRKIQDN
jgi:tellurite resistance protein TerC